MKKRIIALIMATILIIGMDIGIVAHAGTIDKSAEENVEETVTDENDIEVLDEEKIEVDEVDSETTDSEATDSEKSEDELTDEPTEQDESAQSESEQTKPDKKEPNKDNPNKEGLGQSELEQEELEESELEREELELEQEVLDEEELEEVKEEEEEKEPFSKKAVVNNFQITMLAAAGVFPKGAYISAMQVTNTESIENTIESQLGSGKTVKKIQAFDIKVYNNHGEVIQPDTSVGDVHVTISGIDTAPAIYSNEVSMEVFHMNKELDGAEQVGATLSMGNVAFDAEGFSTYAVVTVDKVLVETEDPNTMVKEMRIEGITLSEDENNAAKISKDTEISVTYVFKNDTKIFLNENNKSSSGIYIYTGETYNLPSIPAICVGNGIPGDIDVRVDGASEPLGTIHFEGTDDNKGAATFKITLTTEEAMELQIHDAGFKLKLQLNLQEDVTTEKYALAFGDKTYYVKVKEKMAQPPVISKKAVSYENGDITWEVELKNNAKPIEYSGLTFTDTIGENQVYVAGSFEVKEGDATTLTSSSDTSLVWNYGNYSASHVARFQYKTRVDFLGLTSDATADTTVTKDVKNTVKVEGTPTSTDYEKLSDTKTATQSVSKVVKSWVTKDGGVLSSSGTAPFTVVIQNNGYTLKELHLIDTITADKGVEIQISGLTITDKNNTTLVEDTDYKVSFDGRKQDIEFLKEISGDETLTVKYDATIVDYVKYLKQNHSVPSNSATITYKYNNGSGVYAVVPKPPTVTKNFSGTGLVANATLKKSFEGYNPVTHEMEWKIAVNYNEQNLYKVTIEDTIPAGQTYVDGSVVGADGTTIGTIDSSSTAGKVLISLGDLEGKSATFTLKTKLNADQSEFWASNQQTKTYTNKATLISYESDKTTKNVDVTVSATGTCKSTVLTKKADNYDYNNHTIRYELTLDSNKMEMNDVNVTDVLAAELKLVADSVKIISGADGAEGFTNTFSENTNTLALHFDKLTDEVKVEFVAKIKDTSIFNANKTTKINNQAILTSAEYTGEVTSDKVETTINNIHFKKDRGTVSDDVVPYTIKINQAQEPIYKSGETEIYVQDVLGESLTLDKTSIHLYEANVAANGVMTEGTEVALDLNTNLFIGKNGRQTAMKVVLPNTSKAYILKYSAAMTNRSSATGAYNNDASLMGSTSTTATKSSVDMSAHPWSNAQMRKRVYAKVILKDKRGDGPLAGGHFALFDGETKLDESVTDSNGEIYFVGDLEENKQYTLKEETAPDKYEIPESEAVKTVKGIMGKTEVDKAPTIVYNIKKSKTIQLILLDKDDKTTELTKGALSVKEGTTEVATSSSSISFKAIYGVVYSVNESTIPFGYKGLFKDGCSFVVNEDTEVLEFSGTVPADAEIDGDKIKAYDEKLQSLVIKIDDQSTKQNRSLVGAKILLESVADDDTKTKVDEWDSTGEFINMTLPEGNYLLSRTMAPRGYDNILRTMKFRVSKDSLSGKLALAVLEDDANNKVKTLDDIKLIVNEDNNNTDTVLIDLSTPEDIENPPILEVYEIKTDEDGNPISIGAVWTSESEEPFEAGYQVDYVLKEKVPEKEEPTLEPVYFTVDNDGKVLTKDKIDDPVENYKTLQSDSDGPTAVTPKIKMKKVPPKPVVAKTETASAPEPTPVVQEPEKPAPVVDKPKKPTPMVDKPEEVKPEEVKPEEVKPEETEPVENKPVDEKPVEQKSADSNHESHSGNSAVAGVQQAVAQILNPNDDVVGTGEVVISITEGRPKLAQTGGFLGALTGYLTGIILVIVGYIIAFWGRKKYKNEK